MRTALYLNNTEMAVLVRGEPFNLTLANGLGVSIQLDPLLKERTEAPAAEAPRLRLDGTLERSDAVKPDAERPSIPASKQPSSDPAPALFSCDECGRVCENARGLGVHKNFSHGFKSAGRARTKTAEKCGECGASFPTIRGLEGHKTRVHGAGVEPWECMKCETEFKTEAALDAHMEKGCMK